MNKKINKKIKKTFSFFNAFFNIVLLLTSFLTPLMTTYALSYVTLNYDGVKVRNGAGTSYATLGVVNNDGTTYTLLDTVSTSDGTTACSTSTWYKISYASSSGYICSAYASVSTQASSSTASYNRPWTTPKISIVNGASMISSSYISKNQDSIYLQRFNVDPSAYYNSYTHQYQTNLTAPYTEAKSSYSIYSKSNLLSDPIVFEIPIYDNMPTTPSAYPNGLSDDSGESTVLDTAFEADLDAQGFPESYKKKLRELHKTHANWVFKAIKTNLDWGTAVGVEQPNSYVYSYNDSSLELLQPYDSSLSCLRNDGSGYCVKEGTTWYLANISAVAYYMDPRNFLAEDTIFMFEKLGYSSIYTEAVLQSFLDNTFMSGTSNFDNQSYASIFVEAGKTANISAIYLASLVVQEVGVSGSAATTGAPFTYNGVKYQGVYNFYNIGANSTVYDGLYWANGGATSTIVSDSGGSSSGGSSSGGTSSGGSTTTPTVPDAATFLSNVLTSSGLAKYGDYYTGLSLGEKLSDLKNANSKLTVNAVDSNGNAIADNSAVSTGAKVTITDGTNTNTFTIVVYGDINGDGSINAIDLLYMRKYLLDTSYLTGTALASAHVAKAASIDAKDLLYMRKYLLDSNTYPITQQ